MPSQHNDSWCGWKRREAFVLSVSSEAAMVADVTKATQSDPTWRTFVLDEAMEEELAKIAGRAR